MRLGDRPRIGIRALFDLAFHGAGRHVQAKEIAQRQRVPVRSLSEVLQELRKAGLVEAQRGPRGGYALTRQPAAISVCEILDAFGEHVEQFPAFDDGTLPRRGRPARVRRGLGVASAASGVNSAPDVPALVWGDVAGRAVSVLKTATLYDFIARAESAGIRRADDDTLMYFI
jgi:Rrf2 family protein